MGITKEGLSRFFGFYLLLLVIISAFCITASNNLYGPELSDEARLPDRKHLL